MTGIPDMTIPCRIVCNGVTLEILVQEAPGVWSPMFDPIELRDSVYDIQFNIYVKNQDNERS